jgi:hypothetical protein
MLEEIDELNIWKFMWFSLLKFLHKNTIILIILLQ